MGSGGSKSKSVVKKPAHTQSANHRNNGRPNMNEEIGSSTAMQIAKAPSSIDEIVDVRHHSIRYRFQNDPYIRKVVVPRLTDLVKKTKISCLKSLTIENEYGKQLQAIIDIIQYETDKEGNPQDEKQERPAVVTSNLADFVDKLGFVWTLAKALKILKKNRSSDFEETEKEVRRWAAMFSVLNANVCNTYRKSGILDMVFEDLQDPTISRNYTGPENLLQKLIIITSIIIAGQCAMHGTIDLDQKSKLSAIIYPYSRCTEKTVRINAVLCLCQLPYENGKDMFLEDDILVLILTDALRHALDSPDHCCAGVRLQFLLNGLAQLASKDTNHSMLVSNGVIDLLKSVLRNGNTKEKNVSMNAVWSLSFDPAARQIIKEDSEMLELLTTERSCQMSAISNAADAVIKHVDVNDTAEADEGREEIDVEETTEDKEVIDAGEETPKKLKHVMISYQWDTQEILLRVRDKLKEFGYIVWMDVDNLEGSTLQAMAEAVEDAVVVLVCYSHRYKSSPNTRTEAEYAFQLRRDIIPLKMEVGYQADGWLGAIIGTKLYIEVDPEGDDFETSMQKLTKELGDRGRKQGDDITDAVVPNVEDATHMDKAVSQWSRREVIKWARQNGIKSRKAANLIGEDLLFLRNLRKEAPEYFFSYLESKLGITSLNQMRIFTTALKNL